MKILVLNRSDLERVLAVDECIDAMRAALIAFSTGRAIQPVRLSVRFHDTGLLRSMPAWLDDGPALGVKSITNFPGNDARGLAPILATFLLLDAETGATISIMDGTYLTEVRTAAASAAATLALAGPDSTRLALLGAGVQARSHLAALAAVLPLERVRVASRTLESAERFAAGQADRYPGISFEAARSPAAAISDADVVCTVSSSREPLVAAEAVPAGCHINAVGSHSPGAREIDGETMRLARVIVDSREANLTECGDCLIPIEEGLFGPEHVSDELGQVLAGLVPGRTDDGQVTIYQSCGIAVQDVAAGRLAYEKARSAGVGVEVDL